MADMRAALIIPAAGFGRRMGVGNNKVLLQLDGKTILEYTLAIFADITEVIQLIVVCRREEMAEMALLVKKIPANWQWDIVEGGSERYLSVRNGVEAVRDDVDLIAVHDAVRPLVLKNTVLQAFSVALEKGASLVGVFAKDTIKVVSPEGIISATPARASLFHAQTPQVFKRALFIRAHKGLTEGLNLTDDCSVVERTGQAIHIVEGSPDNIKITTPEDIPQAKAILASRTKSI